MNEEAVYEDYLAEILCECHIADYIDKDWIVYAHWSDYIEVIYVVSGQFEIFLNGKYQILQQGALIFINSQVVHAFKGTKLGNALLIVVKFDKEILLPSAQSPEFPYVSLLLSNYLIGANGNCILFPDSHAGEQLLQFFQTMVTEYKDQRFGYELALRAEVSRVFLYILRNGYPDYAHFLHKYKDEHLHIQELHKVAKQITLQYANPPSALDASRQCNVSYSYFSRRFKAMFGKSYIEYINFVRIMEAEKLLISSSKTITEIALDVGFASSSYFIKLFHLIRHASPKQYRKMLFNK